MIGVDTNVLLRYLTGDDAAQSPQAKALIDGTLGHGEQLFISLPVVLETIWTLRSAFGVGRVDLCATLSALANTEGVVMQEPDAVGRAVCCSQSTGCDLADALIAELGRRAGCSTTATFDLAAASRIDAMTPVMQIASRDPRGRRELGSFVKAPSTE